MVLRNAEKITEVYGIIDPRKLAIDVAKFSACFCHQSIDHPVCKLLVGTYNGGYFSVEKNSLRLQLNRGASTIKR